MRIPRVPLFGIGLVVACSWPTTSCGCSPIEYPRALVVGTVRGPGEIALRGVTTRARTALGSCSPLSRLVGPGYFELTDSTGAYRRSVQAVVANGDTICVQMIAVRSTGAQSDSIVSPAVNLQLRSDSPYDSTRLDFRFP
jgi:hypothetical protein